MDLGGLVGMDGLAAAAAATSSSSATSFFFPSEADSRGQNCVFGFYKQGRPASDPDEHDWMSFKTGKAAPFLLRPSSHSFSPDGEQMLSFSSHKQDALPISSDGTLPFHHRGADFGGGSSSVHGGLAGIRAPFTLSQWEELEHQALIYKYINANMPIPSSLLVPIRSSVTQSDLPHLLAGSVRSGALGWGSYLGFSRSADAEPGRCRRTDGKKWRCSRDAVADGKYCERHMNRGRHRSRKHVEGRNGHVTKAAIAASCSEPAGSLSIAQQPKILPKIASDPPSLQFNRIAMSRESSSDGVLRSHGSSTLLAPTNSKPSNTHLSNSKHQYPFCGTDFRADIGLLSAHSLLSPSRKSFFESSTFNSSTELNIQHSHKPELSRSDRPSISQTEEDDLQLDRTQLSISIPMASSEFSSSSSSPNHEKSALSSTLTLHTEFDPIQMGLGVGVLNGGSNPRHASWMPFPWEESVGGPLGEVLTSTNNVSKDGGKLRCSSPSLNMAYDWDSSPRTGSSPNYGVLQKTNTAFGSLFSSTGCCPSTENHKPNGVAASLHDGITPSTITLL